MNRHGWIRMACLGVGAVLGMLALGGPAEAAPFVQGDVFAATASGTVLHYDGAGNFIETVPVGSGLMTGMAFDGAGDLYVTRFLQGDVRKIRGAAVGTIDLGTFGSGYSGAPESIVFDAGGSAYVGAVQPSPGNGDNDVRKFTPAGVPAGQFDVPIENRGSDWIELAADQRTLFYTSEGRRILRFDVQAGAPLTDFTLLPGSAPEFTVYALRLLGDGGLLVADSANIKRLNSSGVIIQTYDDVDVDGADIDNWFALTLDPDGTSFWSADFFPGSIRKFDIATGAVLLRIDTGFTDLGGLAIQGEITQALVPGGGGGAVAGPATLLLLGSGMLGLVAARRFRGDGSRRGSAIFTG